MSVLDKHSWQSEDVTSWCLWEFHGLWLKKQIHKYNGKGKIGSRASWWLIRGRPEPDRLTHQSRRLRLTHSRYWLNAGPWEEPGASQLPQAHPCPFYSDLKSRTWRASRITHPLHPVRSIRFAPPWKCCLSIELSLKLRIRVRPYILGSDVKVRWRSF